MLKELHLELKSMRTENELLKKDNRLMTAQLETIERQHAKERQAQVKEIEKEMHRM